MAAYSTPSQRGSRKHRMAELIAVSVLDTDTLDPDAREAAYLAFIDGIIHTTFLFQPIHARFVACFLDDLHVIRLDASRRRSERLATRIGHDRHDGISAQLILSGRATGVAGARTVVSEPGTVMLLDYAQTFSITDEEPRDVVNLSIPRARLAPYLDEARDLHGMVIDAREGVAALFAGLLAGTARRMHEMPEAVVPVLGEGLVKLLLLALGCDPTQTEERALTRRAATGDRARQLIDARLGSTDLTPEWLIAKLNVSRSDLYALFEDAGGVARYIWRRRLDRIHQALLDPSDSRRIGEIAFSFGFSSQAHFARAFQAAFGRTARETRRGVR